MSKQAFGKNLKLRNKTVKQIENINSIIAEYQKRHEILTIRQIYYQLVARKMIDNSKDEYDKITAIISKGRLAGLIDWNAIEDRTRYQRSNNHWNSPAQILEAAANTYQIDTRATQPFYIECWVEKDSLISIVEDTCSALDVACFSCRGNPSITSLYDAAIRFQGKDGILFYAGDHDPTGLQIPENIKERLKDFGVNKNIDFRRIALTLEQAQNLGLPPFPAKEKDGNFTKYVKNTGTTQAWELDALPPGMLANLFEVAVKEVTDFTALKELQEKEKEGKTYLRKIQAGASYERTKIC